MYSCSTSYLPMTVCIVSVSFVSLSEQLLKTSEVGRRPIHGVFCGDHIMGIYIAVCDKGINKRLKREYKTSCFSLAFLCVLFFTSQSLAHVSPVWQQRHDSVSLLVLTLLCSTRPSSVHFIHTSVFC